MGGGRRHKTGGNKRTNPLGRIKRALRKVGLPLWTLAFVASVWQFMLTGEYRGIFWCCYVLYADFIFAL